MPKKPNHDLAVVCVVLAIEVAKIVNKVLALLGAAINYICHHEPEMDFKVRTQAWNLGLRPDGGSGYTRSSN